MNRHKRRHKSKRRTAWIEGRAFHNQARPRVRLQGELHQAALQLEVIDAIRRSCEVDEEGLFDDCVEEVLGDEELAGEFKLLVKLVDMIIDDRQPEKAATILKANLGRINEYYHREDTCHSLAIFDEGYLNGNGALALGAAIVYELMDLDPVKVDEAVMGETLQAAYGRRKTREQQSRGKELQEKLKRLLSLDEGAVQEAADRYVRYRYEFNGDLKRFMTCEHETGDYRSERYYRGWFGKFNGAFGFEPQWK